MSTRRERLLAAIEKERQTVAALERQVASLRQKDDQRQHLKEKSPISASLMNEDPWDLVFSNEEAPTLKILQSLDSLETEEIDQNPLIREFCFVRVDRQSHDSYQLEGYFHANPKVVATFDLTFHMEAPVRLTSLEGHLKMNDWLMSKTRPSDPLHLADWITNLHDYLSFATKQEEFLRTSDITVVDSHQGRTVIRLEDLELAWVYKFSQGRDVLRLIKSRGGQLGLDSLVRTCGNDCQRALTVIQRQQREYNPQEERYALSPTSGRQRSAYEIQRLIRMERNQEKLASLGLASPTTGGNVIGMRKKRVLHDYRADLVQEPSRGRKSYKRSSLR